jgi:hypothetical protein
MNDTKITLTNLTVNDMNVIMAGLGKLPMEVSIELWQRIKAEAESQLQPNAGGTD